MVEGVVGELVEGHVGPLLHLLEVLHPWGGGEHLGDGLGVEGGCETDRWGIG